MAFFYMVSLGINLSIAFTQLCIDQLNANTKTAIEKEKNQHFCIDTATVKFVAN